ncbi:hypothetical protein PR048_007755 [Dryococelus australis]|uniref:Uncharacterized protein n=1 Tax=Dryococelus australis TaxID=614101 RepID=A0ABQ9HV53_9NEOP|nr:hypothetical protein PR048_007755 [Dryococelus australis]
MGRKEEYSSSVQDNGFSLHSHSRSYREIGISSGHFQIMCRRHLDSMCKPIFFLNEFLFDADFFPRRRSSSITRTLFIIAELGYVSRSSARRADEGEVKRVWSSDGMKEREKRETGENSPTSGIVRHDSHLRNSGVNRPGIESGSPWWEASSLTAPWPLHRKHFGGREEGGNFEFVSPNFRVVQLLTRRSYDARLSFNCQLSFPAAWATVLQVTIQLLIGRGGVVVGLLASHLGELGSIRGGNRAGRRRWSTGFLGDIPFIFPCILALHHTYRFTLIVFQDLAVKSRPYLFVDWKTTLRYAVHIISNLCHSEPDFSRAFEVYRETSASFSVRGRMLVLAVKGTGRKLGKRKKVEHGSIHVACFLFYILEQVVHNECHVKIPFRSIEYCRTLSSITPATQYRPLKAVHDKVSTFEINLGKKSLPLPACVLTGALSGMRTEKLVMMEGKADALSMTSRRQRDSVDEYKLVKDCFFRLSLHLAAENVEEKHASTRGALYLWCNLPDLFKLSLHEAEEYLGRRAQKVWEVCHGAGFPDTDRVTCVAGEQESVGGVQSRVAGRARGHVLPTEEGMAGACVANRGRNVRPWTVPSRLRRLAGNKLRSHAPASCAPVTRMCPSSPDMAWNETLGWSGAGMQGQREYPEKTLRQAASSSTIPTCENPGVNPDRRGQVAWVVGARHYINTYSASHAYDLCNLPSAHDRTAVISRRSISTLASYQGEPGSIPGRITGFSQVGIVPDDAVGRRVSSGMSRFPPFLYSGTKSYSSGFNLIGSRDIDVKRRPILLTPLHSLPLELCCEPLKTLAGISVAQNAFGVDSEVKTELPQIYLD